MLMSRDRNYSLAVIVAVLFLIGIYYLYMSDSPSESKDDIMKDDDIEYLDDDQEESFQLLDYEEDLDSVGMGVGPGIYGSGREFSEGIGN